MSASIPSRIGAQAAKAVVLRLAGRLNGGALTTRLPNGRVRTFGRRGAQPSAAIDIASDEFFSRVLFGGEIGFGEAYMDGLWRSDDLVALLMWGIENRRGIQPPAWVGRASRIRNVRLHRSRRNTKRAAKDNIHAHYDLGNEFFRLFLDDTMTYSCAYFASPDDSLEDAQRHKYAMLCEKADLQPGDSVLEIGCGWGGFAIYAAERYGCRVTSITISKEQLALAQARVAAAGLSHLVDIRFCDYRDVEGQFDGIISIEMFEAVGAEYFDAFFASCDRALRPGGRFAMQTISVPDRSFIPMRDGVNWMQKYIFPGGMLPSIAAIERALHGTSLVINGVEDIGQHYAITLRHWRERFLARLPEVRAQGFDDRFIRMWEYYLAASEAGFRTRNTGDLQIVFEKTGARVADVTADAMSMPAAEARPIH